MKTLMSFLSLIITMFDVPVIGYSLYCYMKDYFDFKTFLGYLIAHCLMVFLACFLACKSAIKIKNK